MVTGTALDAIAAISIGGVRLGGAGPKLSGGGPSRHLATVGALRAALSSFSARVIIAVCGVGYPLA